MIRPSVADSEGLEGEVAVVRGTGGRHISKEDALAHVAGYALFNDGSVHKYQFKTPLRLPKGTKIDMEYTFDNSADNVRNPSTPPKRVKLGEQTNDEMAILFMNAAVNNAADGKRLAQSMFGQSAVSSVQDKIDEINKLPPDERERAIREAIIKAYRGK